MSDDELNDLLLLKKVVSGYLADVEQQILDYSPHGDRVVFEFIVLKARRYEQTLIEIDRRLKMKTDYDRDTTNNQRTAN